MQTKMAEINCNKLKIHTPQSCYALLAYNHVFQCCEVGHCSMEDC